MAATAGAEVVGEHKPPADVEDAGLHCFGPGKRLVVFRRELGQSIHRL
ncbi:MAG: hypothetical protein ACI4TK_05830 [Agathobacter sp.]